MPAAPPPYDAVISPQTGNRKGRRHLRSRLPRLGARKRVRRRRLAC